MPNFRDFRKAKSGGPLYWARIWKMGKSVVFPLPKLLLGCLKAVPGDSILIRVHPPFVTFRLAIPDELMPVGAFTQDEFPPAWPRHIRPTGTDSTP